MENKGSSLKGSLLLVLLLSNLLLCKTMAYTPNCNLDTGYCKIPLQDLLNRAVMVSSSIGYLTLDVFNTFNAHYTQGRGYEMDVFNSCHTTFLSTPENKQQSQQASSEDILNLVLSILRSWDEPLRYLASNVRGLQEAPDVILSRVLKITQRTKSLQEGMHVILNEIHPGIQENDAYAVWSELPSLQTADEETRLVTTYKLLYCLRKDAIKVDTFLKVLQCRVVYNGNC